MRVHLLGTGPVTGRPDPSCGCPSCRAARRAGLVRRPARAVVDGRLLLAVGPPHEAPSTTVDAVVEAVLATAAADVAGGDRLTAAGHEIVVVPATATSGSPVGYDVTGPDGARLLWAPATGPLPDDALALTAGREYDAVLLDLSGPDDGHHDLRTWGEQVAELRRRGAVTAATALYAMPVGHSLPPPAELDTVLAGWGATAPREDTVLEVGGGTPHPRDPVRLLVLGGARSGKSAYAEQRLAAEPHVTYVATAPPREGDEDWAARVRDHIARRPASWRTAETGDVAGLLRGAHAALLVDDLGLWLTRVVDSAGAWEGPLPPRVVAACDELVDAWRACAGTAVLVTPDVGAGVVPATASGRRFRDLLGALTTRLAAESDEVVQVVAGLPRALR